MESIKKIVKHQDRVKPAKNFRLHSPAHLLADELCRKFGDKPHFGFYLRMAGLYDHNWLRKLAAEVAESPGAKTPGKLFAYLIKKNNQAITAKLRSERQ